MGYGTKYGRRPFEWASKASHSSVVSDPEVTSYLTECSLPKTSEEVMPSGERIVQVDTDVSDPIRHVIAIDGGYREVAVRKEFPSSTLAFLQFGALVFSVADLAALSHQPFIAPVDMAKIRNIQRLKLVLPTKGIALKSCSTLTEAVRTTLYRFFRGQPKGEDFMRTLKWFVFQEYATAPREKWTLASCPNDLCGRAVELGRNELAADYTLKCPACGCTVFLSDVFRLHEAIDNDLGAGGILGYLVTLLEQVILIHLIRTMLVTKPQLLKEVLFIKDGPLAFFGQTANMHRPMRELANFLLDNHGLFLAGLEKSGAFVEHAQQVEPHLECDQALFLDNEYIYRYIIPGQADPSRPYAGTSYYGSKLIFKAADRRVYVVTVPVRNADVVLNPSKPDYPNLDVILTNVAKLKCDMYDSALFPVALVNRLVSLADHPSATILERLARATVH